MVLYGRHARRQGERIAAAYAAAATPEPTVPAAAT
jgi:hypothetical protein